MPTSRADGSPREPIGTLCLSGAVVGARRHHSSGLALTSMSMVEKAISDAVFLVIPRKPLIW